MQKDFHYYATYCAAFLAGYSHEESLAVCYSAQLTDYFSATLLGKIGGPKEAATTQLNMELMNMRPDILSLQQITRIWASFHFLPRDLYAKKKGCTRGYLNKYRLICGPNGDLIEDTVRLASGSSLQAAGLAMHVLADTWAHRYFAGTPSLVINNTDDFFYEIIDDNKGNSERKISFRHSPSGKDDLDNSIYNNSVFQSNEISILNLGHARAGHLPDYSFICYKYMPAWADYDDVVKNNPKDYMSAFRQMVYALKCIRDADVSFVKDTYDEESVGPCEDRIMSILETRKPICCDEWKAFGEELSGCEIEDFDLARHQDEYRQASAEEKDNTFLGRYIVAALRQKSMVTNKIFMSGNLLAGISVDYQKKGLKGIRDYFRIIENTRGDAE